MSDGAEKRGAVWLCQCLCPNRHCILAAADEAETEQEAAAIRETLERKLAELLRVHVFNPWCSLCGAALEAWRYELRRTPFATLDEAMPALREAEARQLLTSRLLGSHGPHGPPRAH